MELVLIILAAAVGLVVTWVVAVYWQDIKNWFQGRNDIKEADAANIAFTIKAAFESGNYKVVQGIFNTESEELVEGRAMETSRLDPKFEQVHADKELVIYE
jgi:hypothetical protein